MKVPLSWVKDFVDVDLPLDELGLRMTMLGLEVDEIKVIGLPVPQNERQEIKINGLAWEPDKIVVAQVDEVMPHPNADRLVLCKLQDGQQEHIVLTGAPNLYPYKGAGPLKQPLKVAYAKEGALIYDGHKPGFELTKLKRAKIRGVESYSMICSEKELGISEEHEGVIILDADAPTGMPLVDYMGDAVYDISILPNMARNASVIGVAREIAAMLDLPLKQPQFRLEAAGPGIEGRAFIEITDPDLNPRFVLGLVEGVEARESPYWVQRRLRLAGMRPINSIVDATNYVMLETGEPLHAFDYDVLTARARNKAPTIITRAAKQGEKLTTLDNVERTLDDFTVLVTDTAGVLSLAGVMGGLESEVTTRTHNVLLEGASWNYINTRRTNAAQRLNSEAGYRFSRGVHPALAPQAVQVGLQRMAEWSGGTIASGLVDAYPRPVIDPVIELTADEVQRMLGVRIEADEVCSLLSRLGFTCNIKGETMIIQTPPHRLDINEGIVGKADVIEEIARLYGYDRLPETRLMDELPIQKNRPQISNEQRLQDVLVNLGLQEIVTYRLTSPEREAKATLMAVRPDEVPYVRLRNPIAADRVVMRRSVLPGVLEILERNIRLREHLAFFEVGQVFLPQPGEERPLEPRRLCVALSGKRQQSTWDRHDPSGMDFYDIKGVLQSMLDVLRIKDISYESAEHPSFHPGKCASLNINGHPIGVFGELHPLVSERYDFLNNTVLAAELDLSLLYAAIPEHFDAKSLPAFPPVLEDLAVVVDEDVPAETVLQVIITAGGKLLDDVKLFDIFRGRQIGEGKKSLAYSLTYLSPERTLTDKDVAKARAKIIQQLEAELGASLRS